MCACGCTQTPATEFVASTCCYQTERPRHVPTPGACQWNFRSQQQNLCAAWTRRHGCTPGDNAKTNFEVFVRDAVAPLSLRTVPSLRTEEGKNLLEMKSLCARWAEPGERVDAEIWSAFGEPLGIELRNPLMNSLQIIATERLRARGVVVVHLRRGADARGRRGGCAGRGEGPAH